MSEIPYTYLMCGVLYENRHVDSNAFGGHGSTATHSAAYGHSYASIATLFGDGAPYGDSLGEIDVEMTVTQSVRSIYSKLHIGEFDLDISY